MASLLPVHSSGGSRSKGRSRLSSSAVAADSPYAADIPGSLTSRSDRQEARRRLGRSGKGFVDVSLLDEEEDECSEPDMPLLQLQPPPDSCTRRVTFSAAGGTEQQLVQQQQADQPNPVLLQAARLWRGAAASVCAGQRLQSLERHAAQLKQRQEIHTELKAWVEQVLSQPQEESLDPALENSSSNIVHAALSDDGQQQQQQHRRHQHHRHSQQLEPADAEGAAEAQGGGAGGAGGAGGGEHHRRRKSSHRHKRHSHKHHHQAAAEGLEGAPQQDADRDAAAAAEAGQAGAEGVPAVGPEAGQQSVVSEPLQQVQQVQQEGEQWHQFNAAEQQLIAQMQQDQQQLIEQLQQAYQQIAALTAAQEAAATAAAAALAGGQQQQPQQQQQADVVLHPAPDTQVLVIARNSNDSQGDHGQQHTLSLRDSTDMREEAEQQDSQAVQPTARRSSIISSPRTRRTSTAAAGIQPASSPRTPRAAGKASKATAAAGANSKATADLAAPATPRKSLQAAAAAKSKGRASLPVPQGRGLTLPQQQALVQRLQQAEEVMDLLQQDLQESLQAQQLLQEQLQQVQGTGRAEGCAGDGQVSDPQQDQPLSEQDQHGQEQGAGGSEPSAVRAEGDAVAQQEGQAPSSSAQADAHTDSEQSGVVVVAEVLALQQQLQEQLQLSNAAQQELAEARELTAAQQQQIEELQQHLQQQQQLEQKQGQYVQRIEALQEQLDGLNKQLQALQQKQELSASNGTEASSQYQQLLDNMSPQQLQELLLQQQLGTTAPAVDGSLCCQHEARCQHLQSILQALLRQLQAKEAQQHSSCSMRPYTAATGSPRARATWQHRPVELHTWLYPPLQVPRPATQQSAHINSQLLQPATEQSYHRSVSAPRCATASSPRHTKWDRMTNRPASPGPKCNTTGALTARYSGGAAAVCQDSVLQSLEYRLRPLTYRGPDRAAADAIATATGGRRRLSADAEKGLLASLHVGPVSARGKSHMQAQHNIAARQPPVSGFEDAEMTVDTVGGLAIGEGGFVLGNFTRRGSGGMCSPGRQRRADVAGKGVQGSSNPRSARAGQGFQQGTARRGVPRLVLGGLY